jgi:hypothetical protein
MRNPHAEGAGASKRLAGQDEGSTRNTPQTQPLLSRQAAWQAANPKARWAHIALASALRRGLLQRQPCVVCGAEKVDGHHPDYDRPMDVVWLCRRHHHAVHRKGAS